MKYKLICFDMDGVIFKSNNFWKDLHVEMGTWYQGKILTDKYLKTDYKKLVETVVKGLWYKRNAKHYYNLISKAQYNPNINKLVVKIKEMGSKTCIVTAGPYDLALRAQKELGIDYIEGNKLIVENGLIKDFSWLIGNDNKVEVLKIYCGKENISMKEVLAIGDEQNDIKLFKEAGFSIAFNTENEELKKSASVVVNSENLLDLLKYIK